LYRYITAARRLAFAQMIVSAQAKGNVGGGADVPVLVTRRNEVAVDCLRKAIEAKDVTRIGLLYGGLHMPGLTKSVMEDLVGLLGLGLVQLRFIPFSVVTHLIPLEPCLQREMRDFGFPKYFFFAPSTINYTRVSFKRYSSVCCADTARGWSWRTSGGARCGAWRRPTAPPPCAGSRCPSSWRQGCPHSPAVSSVSDWLLDWLSSI
jgi:hypothetical protein